MSKDLFLRKVALLFICIIDIEADILSNIKIKVRTLGTQTAIDIALYAKNLSTGCSLKITNIINLYKQKQINTKLLPIVLESGRYYREDVIQTLKGAYEFEYGLEVR